MSVENLIIHTSVILKVLQQFLMMEEQNHVHGDIEILWAEMEAEVHQWRVVLDQLFICVYFILF